MQPTSSRQPYLDWLRIMSIIGVLVFHSAMAFVSEWEWHIKNRETSNILLEFNFWLGRFRMPLLFFISGTVSYFMLQKKSGKAFVALRFRRLFIPLLFGMLVIVPPQIYVERLTQGFKGSYLDFYKTVFEFKPYPGGNFSWHHLWFILYLFIYDILCTPLFKWLMNERGQQFLQKMNFLARGQWIYLFMLPSAMVFAGLIMQFPATHDLIHDWCYFFYWLLFLLAGFIFIANPVFMDSLERNRRTSLALALIITITINYFRWNDLEPFDTIVNYKSDWRTYAFLSLFAIMAWSWIMTAIGYGKRYLNKKHRSLDYINQAVYPFYILHQTVILILVYYVVQTPDTVGMKYIFVVLVSFVLSMGIYHVFIRPFALTRFLFGMKPKGKESRYLVKENSAVISAEPRQESEGELKNERIKEFVNP